MTTETREAYIDGADMDRHTIDVRFFGPNGGLCKYTTLKTGPRFWDKNEVSIGCTSLVSIRDGVVVSVAWLRSGK